MNLEVSSITLKGAPLGKSNPLPYLRDPVWDRVLDGSRLKECDQIGFGYGTGYRVLPYTVYDGYGRERHPMEIKTIVMENRNLRATFLPEYGGRLYSLYDKLRGKELLFVNTVFQPCNIGLRSAWFSGGIEWNVGQHGHSSLTCDPMFFAHCRDKQGASFLRVYEYERIKGFFLQIDFHLPENEKHLYAHVNIYNSHDAPASLYWWTNTAVEQNRRMRVLSASPEVIVILPNNGNFEAFMHDTMPWLEGFKGLDASYPENSSYSTEYFFQNKATYEQSWEAVAYDDGSAFYERSTLQMPYRKMFYWSDRRGGRHWQEFLSEPGVPYYAEIQAGLYPTQVHGGDLPAKAQISFTQAFGGMETNPKRTHCDSYTDACAYMYGKIEECLSKQLLSDMDTRFKESRDVPIGEFLHYGSGWGALEQIRESGIVPKGLDFPPELIGEEQLPFAMLLKQKTMPPWNGKLPQSYMCDQRWLHIMDQAIQQMEKPTAELLFHYGIASYENGYIEQGIAALRSAMVNSSAPVISRTLGMMLQKTGDLQNGADMTRKAIEDGGLTMSPAFAIDYIDALVMAKRFQEAWNFYLLLPDDMKENERIQMSVATAACETEQWDFLNEQFTKEFVFTREGDMRIMELWFKCRALKLAEEERIDFEQALKIVKSTEHLPYEIDFLVYSEYKE